MELDRTLIAVRERSLLETVDLALHVTRRYIWPLCATFALGAVPIAIINHLLAGWMLRFEFREGFFYLEEADSIVRYLWSMTLLVFITAPLASIFTTKFLGDAVFVEQPSIRSAVKVVWQLSHRIAWCQLVVRGVGLAWVLLATVWGQEEFQVGREFLLMGGLAAVVGALRSFRPYLNEVVLLECNPLLGKGEHTITVSKRSLYLHSPSSGDLFSRWIGGVMVAILLVGTVFGTFLFCSGVFFNDWRPGPWMLLTVYPISLWIVAGFMTVVRFLGYLDLRIRHEGWETELLLRAEAARLAGRIT